MADETTQLFVGTKGADAGKLFRVPADEAAQAADWGWKPATDADVAAHAARKEAGSAKGQIRTLLTETGANVIDAATAIPRVAGAIGLAGPSGDALQQAIPSGHAVIRDIGHGVDRLRGVQGPSTEEADAMMRRDAEANPGTALAGQLVGNIVGAEATGLGAIAKGVGGAVRGAATATGEAAGLGARLAGATVGGAVEGVAFNVANESSQAYLQSRQLGGEQVLAAGGLGMLLGGGLGMVSSGLGEAYGAAKNALGERAAARGAAEAGTDVAAAAGKEPTLLQGISKTRDEDLVKVATDVLGEKPLPKFAENYLAARNGADLQMVRREAVSTATNELSGAINEASRVTQVLTDNVDSKVWKTAQVAENLAKSGVDGEAALAATRERSAAMLSDLDRSLIHGPNIEGFGNQITEGGAPTIFTGLRNQVAKQVRTIQRAENAEEAYVAFDQIRRDLYKTSKSFYAKARSNQNVDISASYKAYAEQLGAHYDDSFKYLMDKSVWGEQGAAQEAVNNARVKLIQAQQYAFPHFANEVGTNYEGLARVTPQYAADDGKLFNTIQKLGSVEGRVAEGRVQQYIDATKTFSDAMKSYGMTPDTKAAVESLSANAAKLQKTFAEVTSNVGSLNQVDAFLQKAKGGAGAVGGGMIGGMLGGHVGAAVGSAVGAVANPAKFIGQRMAVEQMISKAGAKFNGALDTFFAGARKSATAVTDTATVAAAKAGASQAGWAAIPQAMAAFMGKHATPEQAYRARVGELQAANQNMGQGVRDAAVKSFGDLVHSDPHVVGSAVVAATAGINYLLSKTQPIAMNPNSLTPRTSAPIPSRAEIADFARVFQAVDKPMSVMRDLANGTMTHDQVDAIHAVYPQLYDWIRTETMNRLRKMDGDSIEVPIQHRLLLDSLLDLDGAGEPTFSNEFAAKYGAGMSDQAQQKAQQKQAPPKPRGASKVPDLFATGTTTMLGGTKS